MNGSNSRFIKIMNTRIDKNSIKSFEIITVTEKYSEEITPEPTARGIVLTLFSNVINNENDSIFRTYVVEKERAVRCLVIETYEGETYTWNEDMIDVDATIKMLDELL